jgi:uncharacterized protein YndB with AHSA1/START domain
MIMDNTKFVYVTYISAKPDEIWKALIDPKTTKKYWQHENISEWKPGSRWEHRRSGKGKGAPLLVGKVIEFSAPRRLVLTWAFAADEENEGKHTRVRIDIESYRKVARLIVTHDLLELNSEMHRGIMEGWPKVLSSLKSLMEVGKPLPELWEK